MALGCVGGVWESDLFGETVLVATYRTHIVAVLESLLLGDLVDREGRHSGGGWDLVPWMGPALLTSAHHGHLVHLG